MKTLFYRLVLKFGGWTVVNNLDQPFEQAVIIGAPHTSNWDFVYALPGLNELNITGYRYLIKKEFFFWPFSWLFNSTGGIAVDRSKKNDLTENLKSMLASGKLKYLLFPPEGTRSRVDRWKTGFYYTAVDTGLPIVLGFMNYEDRIMGLGKIFYPTGDINRDMGIIEDFYREIPGKNPKNYNPQIYIRD